MKWKRKFPVIYIFWKVAWKQESKKNIIFEDIKKYLIEIIP
jgi:hypothetical protein